MSDLNKQITIKLIIDGKEATATFDVVKGSFLETGKAAEKVNEQLKKTYTSLISEALKYNTVNDANVQALTKYITTQGLTIDQIEDCIYALDKETNVLAINSGAWESGMAASANLKASMGGIIQQQTGMNTAMQAGVPGANAMRMAMMQFGYVLNDAQTFMISAKMGLMGISNNLPMIIQLMQDAKKAAGEKANMMKLLTQSLMGGGGLIIGINALMLLLQVLPGLFEKSTNKMKELLETMGEEEKKVRIQQIEYNALIGILNNVTASEDARNGALKTLKKEYPEYLDFLENEKVNHNKITEALKRGNEEFEKKIQLASSERMLKEYYDQAADAEYQIQKLTEKRKEMQKQFDEGNKARGFSLFAIDKDVADLEIKKNEAIKKVQEFNLSMSQLNAGIRDTDKDKPGAGLPEDKFADAKTKAVDKFIKEEYEKSEAARIAGKDYISLLQELEFSEIDYATVVEKVKDARTQSELDSLTKLADLTEIRIDLIKNAIEAEEKLNHEEMEDWRKKRDQIYEFQQKILKDREKFEEDKKKFFRELSSSIESDPLERQKKELGDEEQLTIERAQMYGASEEIITNLKRYYEHERLRIAKEAHLQELEEIRGHLNQVSGIYNQIYGIISSNVRAEVDAWKDSENQKIEKERQAALAHVRNSAERQKINEHFDKRKEALEKEADKRGQARLEIWFNLQKGLAMAEIGINLAKAISVEWGKLGVFAIITQGFVIAALTAQMVAVASQKFPKGFAEGGRLPKGRAGIIEGTHNEIIAPEEDFKTLFKTHSADIVKTTLMDYKNYVSINAGSADSRGINDKLTKLESTVNKLNKILDEGIDARAVYDEDAASKIYIKGRGRYRRSKI